MDEEKKEAEKIDVFNPAIVFAFVAASIGDFTFFLIITHYLCGILVLAMFLPKAKGILAKLVLGIAFILPGPFLMIGVFLAIILSNKALAFIAEQAAVIAATVFLTPAGGAAVEGAALAGEAGGAAAGAAIEAGAAATEAAATAAEVGAEAATAAAEVGEAGVATAGGAEAATGAAEAGEAAGGAAETGEAAEEMREGKSALEKARDIKEKLDKLKGGGREEGGEENEEEDLDLAATSEERALLGEKGRLNEEFFERPVPFPVPSETDEQQTPQQNNVVSSEKFREARKIEDIKRQQQKPKPIQQVPIREENEGDNNRKKAA